MEPRLILFLTLISYSTTYCATTSVNSLLDILVSQTNSQEKSLINMWLIKIDQDEHDLHQIEAILDEFGMKSAKFAALSNASNDEIGFHLLLKAFNSEIKSARQKVIKRLNAFDEFYEKLTPMLDEFGVKHLENHNYNREPSLIGERILQAKTIAVFLESFEKKNKLTLMALKRSLFNMNEFRTHLNKEISFSCSSGNQEQLNETMCDHTYIDLIRTCSIFKPSGIKYQHAHLVQACESQTSNRTGSRGEKKSILSLIPVLYGNKSYANIYCMICNEINVDLKQLEFFQLVINKTKIDFGNFMQILNQDFYPPSFMSFQPSNNSSNALKCFNFIDKCFEYQLNKDRDIFEGCYANHTDLVRVGNDLYKNKYCAFCNDINSFDLKCPHDASLEKINKPISDALAENLKINLVEFALVNDNIYNNYLEFVLNFKIVNDLLKETSLRVSCIFEKFSFHLASEHYEMDEYNFEDLSGQHLTTSFCENLFDETLLRSFKNFSLTKKNSREYFKF